MLLPRDATEIQARVTWGDYVTEPPLDDAVFLPEARKAAEDRGEKPDVPARNSLHWRRIPREEIVTLPLSAGDEPQHFIVPDSAAPMAPGGGLELVVSVHPTATAGIDGVKRDLLAVSVFLVDARAEALGRFGDLAFRTAASRMARISASVLRLWCAARTFKARCVSSERLRMVTAGTTAEISNLIAMPSSYPI